jgi:F-type H+-transporting ATPase subunit b
MDLFKIEPGLFIWTWISFGVMFLVLNKLVFPALLGGIKERERKIAESIDKAEEIETRLSDIEAERRQVVENAKKEADAILRGVRKESAELKDKLAAKAAKEAAEILEDARRKIEGERVAVINALRDDLAEFVCEASGKLVGQAMTGNKEREYARELVDDL